MLNLDVEELENFKMEEQIHLSITAIICGSVFAAIYYFSTLKESGIAHEVAMMRKSLGLKAGDDTPHRASPPVELGPHSYMTLLLSSVCCAVILLLIYLITLTPSLIKLTPLHKMIQDAISGRVDQEDEGVGTGVGRRHTSEDNISSRERVLETCMELEKRLVRLEQCLVPLLSNLEVLTQHADFQPATPEIVTAELSRENLNGDTSAIAATDLGSAGSVDSPDLSPNPGLRKRSVTSEMT